MGKKLTNILKKSKNFSAIAEKLNLGLVHVEEITAILAYKKVHLMDAVSTCALNEDWKNDTDYSLVAKVKVMIFCTALSREKTGGCITATQN